VAESILPKRPFEAASASEARSRTRRPSVSEADEAPARRSEATKWRGGRDSDFCVLLILRNLR